MEQFILVVHVLLALGIIGLIMLQQGKGAEMGASFGSGSSQTVFGAAGTGNFFSHMTGILAAVFFVTSVTLAVIAKNTSVIDEDFLPAINSSAEAVIGDLEGAAVNVGEATTPGGTENLESESNAVLEQATSAAMDIKDSAEGAAADAKKTLENAAKALETEN
jgi:preprotein translocase subunit SecG